MIELPEAATLSRQITDTFAGKRVMSAAANESPHKFAWYSRDPAEYGALLSGRRLSGARAFGGHVAIELEGALIALNDGPNPRFVAEGEKRPAKRQLLIEFDSGEALVCSVQMYGGMSLYLDGEKTSDYFEVARAKPSPLSDGFTEAYFDSLRAGCEGKLSAKAFLATEQRVPGLGNGVLQDILYAAKIHPKRKLSTLSDADMARLYSVLRAVLGEMTALGGRDVERDLMGRPGGYATKCSRITVGAPCPLCGAAIAKESYLGGAIYYCPGCQTL